MRRAIDEQTRTSTVSQLHVCTCHVPISPFRKDGQLLVPTDFAVQQLVQRIKDWISVSVPTVGSKLLLGRDKDIHALLSRAAASGSESNAEFCGTLNLGKNKTVFPLPYFLLRYRYIYGVKNILFIISFLKVANKSLEIVSHPIQNQK